MNKSNMKTTGQAGFTLIELIVVIVILGILAATALPKFASLGGDARLASLQAAKGALASTVAMAKGRYLVDAGTKPNLTVEGVTLTYTTTGNGYPQADLALAQAAGLSDDYLVVAPGSQNTANRISVAADEIMIIPRSLEGSPSGKTCYVKYKQPAAKTDGPVYTLTATAAGCE